MRVSRVQAAQNRERILDVATRLFREHGIDGIGVADLMKSAGLTHGGFYGHFKSKEDLVAQACGRAVARMRDKWIRTMNHSSAPLETLANEYLAAKHRDNAGRGCPLAALGSEIARQGSVARHTVTEELKPFISYLSEIVQGRSASLRREQAIALYASLVGAVVIARIVDDLEFSNETLHAVANTIQGQGKKRNTPTSRPPATSAKKRIVSRAPRVTKV